MKPIEGDSHFFPEMFNQQNCIWTFEFVFFVNCLRQTFKSKIKMIWGKKIITNIKNEEEAFFTYFEKDVLEGVISM